MKTIFGSICILLAFQSGNSTEEAERVIDDIEILDAVIKPGEAVDTAGLGRRFDGEAMVAPVRHDISDEPAQVGGGSGLVVRAYPGSTPVVQADRDNHDYRWKTPDAGHVLTGETRSYLTRDSLDTVHAYYDTEVGTMQNGSLDYLTVPEGMRSASMRPGPYVYAYPVGGTAHTGLIGVEINALEPIEDHFIRYPSVGPIFGKLNVGVLNGNTSQEKFDRLVNEYKHIAWMFYPLSDQRSEHGKLLSMDQAVFNGCVDKAVGGMSREELQAKIQQLMAQGKMEEMQELAQNMMGASGAGSADVWVDCLTEMEGQGFSTLITIHVGPTQAD